MRRQIKPEGRVGSEKQFSCGGSKDKQEGGGH